MRSVLYPLFTNLWLWIPLFITSLIPLKSGSIFDFIVLPSIITIFFFEILSLKSRIYKDLILIGIFVAIITMQTALLFFLSSSLGTDIFVLTIRITGMIVVYFLSINSLIFKLKQNSEGPISYSPKKNHLESIKFFPFFILILVSLSILKAIQSEYFIGIDFPFYTEEAVNRQIYSPAIMLSSLYLFESLPTKLPKKNLFLNNKIIFIAALLSAATSILSGSRSWFLILIAYVIAKIIQIILKNKLKISETILKLNYKLKVSDFIFIISLLSFTIYFTYYLRNFISVEKIELIFKRLNSISLLIFNYSNDASRGEMIGKSISIFSI